MSVLKTGRAQPSREMLLHLSERLDIPLRERNVLFADAGFAPAFPEHRLDDIALESARAAIDLVLTGHEPYPALAVDRHWTLVAANRALGPFFDGVASHLTEPPVNVLRASLHPDGLAPRITNLGQWRAHMLARLQRQIEKTVDPHLIDLLAELHSYLAPEQRSKEADSLGIVVPLRLRTDCGTLAFLYTTLFGTPRDVTLDEIAIESFFPADPATAEMLRQLATGPSFAIINK